MEFRVLGPLEVRVNGTSLALGGPKQRALLALLLLSANRVVSRDRLVDELWPGEAAGRADQLLRVRISRLRKALASAEPGDSRLVTQAPGYVLRVEPGELDLHRFERLADEGRGALDRGEPELAAARLHEAEALWRGRPLADLEFEPFARADVERLDDLRLAALEARVEADLALGHHATLVPELDALVAESPLREQFRGQLMRALYADGRQAEALAVYTDARRMLVEELGLEPSEELRELERKILRQDPELRARARAAPIPARDTAVDSPRPPETRRGVNRARRGLAAATALAALAATAVVAFHGGSRATSPQAVQRDSVAFIDAHSGKLVGQVATPPGFGPVQAGEGFVWKKDDSGNVLQIDARSFRLIRSIPAGLTGGDLAVGEGAVWISGSSNTLARIDPRYGTVSRLRLPRRGLARPGAAGGVAVGAGSVWAAQGLSRVVRLDPETGRVERTFSVPNAQVLAFGDGALWVASSDLGRLTKIDARTDTVAASSRIGPWICCLSVGGGYVWAANDSGLWKVSASGDPVARISLPNEAGFVAYAAGAAWVTVPGFVIRVDGQTDATTRFHVGHLPSGIGGEGRLIATSVSAGPADVTAHLGRRVLHGAFVAIWFDVTDPAVSAAVGVKNWATEQQLQRATCASLLRHSDAPGQPLVPEIAAAWPTLSPDRRTYSFKIRQGFRFSPPSNAPVTGQVFRYSIERAISRRLGAQAPAVPLASDIVGARAYRAGAASHLSGITATREALAITLVRPAPDFLERISTSYFCPVPIGTPTLAGGLPTPVASAGPYYLSANLGGAVAVLRRNPNYRGTRRRQLDAIVFRQEAPLGSAAARIEAGKDDYVAERGAALAPGTPLAARFGRATSGRPRRLFRTRLLGTDELALNTRSPVFANARVRRAVSLAVDRTALAAALGDVVTDRYLPPGMPGLATARVHPITGPRIGAARRLTGRRAMRVRLAVCDEPGCLEVARTVRANLRPIGIDVGVRRYGGDIAPDTRRRGADMVLARVLVPYPDPVAFLRLALGAARTRNELDAIAHLDGTRRLVAANRLELKLIRARAPVVAFGTPAIPEFFSARVGCQVFAPVSFGVELGSLCLRDR